MKNEKLTADEYDALELIRRGVAHERGNACVGRNAKRLSGIKLIQYAKSGRVALTDKGKELLFLRRCVETLRALAGDPQAVVEADVTLFLGSKSHIVPLEQGGYVLTDKGRESLADIAARA